MRIIEHLASKRKIAGCDTDLDHRIFEGDTKIEFQIQADMKKQHEISENILLRGDMNENPRLKDTELLKISNGILLEDTFNKANSPK